MQGLYAAGDMASVPHNYMLGAFTNGAVAGEDANWGRIVMAVGKAGAPADRDRLSVGVGGVWMARDGAVVPGYDEAPVVAHMRGRDINIAIDLGIGQGADTAWTCDLTHGYIEINGSYRS